LSSTVDIAAQLLNTVFNVLQEVIKYIVCTIKDKPGHKHKYKE